jgi:hypothetical protein
MEHFAGMPDARVHYTTNFPIMQEDLKKRKRFFEPDLAVLHPRDQKVCCDPHHDLCREFSSRIAKLLS